MTVETINTLAIEVKEEKCSQPIFNVPICRICLQEEVDMTTLISPCRCSGSSKYVHIGCLNEWRRTSRNPSALTQCEICSTTYNVRQMTYHLLHNWCVHIKYNVWALFIYHQLVSIMLTLLYYSAQPLRVSQNQLHSQTTSSNTKHVIYSTFTVYICNILTMLIPIIMYTIYVFVRYGRNKGEILSIVCNEGLPSFLSITFCAACTYLVIPEFILLSITLLTWIIDASIMMVFEKIEVVNRRYPQEIILSMDTT